MRFAFHPSRDALSLTAVLFALSDPIRLNIVGTLAAEGDQACGVFTGPTGPRESIPKSTLTHHFKVLREAGIIRTQISGTQRLISLRRQDLDARFPGVLDAILNAANNDTPLPAAA